MKKSTERRKAGKRKRQQRDYGAEPISKAQAKAAAAINGGSADINRRAGPDDPLTDDDFVSPFEGG